MTGVDNLAAMYPNDLNLAYDKQAMTSQLNTPAYQKAIEISNKTGINPLFTFFGGADCGISSLPVASDNNSNSFVKWLALGLFFGVQLPQAASEVGGGGFFPNNPLEGIRYSDKVQWQMQLGDYHSFPLQVDNYGSMGVVTNITGGDGIIRTQLQISGSYRGVNGNFTYIIEPDGVCNHRIFVRTK